VAYVAMAMVLLLTLGLGYASGGIPFASEYGGSFLQAVTLDELGVHTRTVLSDGQVAERYSLVRSGAEAISMLVPSGQRAWVISSIDTEYCRLARRAPGFFSSPLYQGIRTRHQLDQVEADIVRAGPEYVFSDVGPTQVTQDEARPSVNRDVAEPLMAAVRERYDRTKTVGYLEVWRRRATAAGQ
jgi:hypothetical protein